MSKCALGFDTEEELAGWIDRTGASVTQLLKLLEEPRTNLAPDRDHHGAFMSVRPLIAAMIP